MKTKIGHPIFILSLLILILNDWYFKAAFHNDVTGKLSDLSGLFAFPFIFSALFPKHKKVIHISTGLLFLYWNSVLAQPLIDFLNCTGIPIIRTIDWTDNLALISVALSYKLHKTHRNYKLTPILQKMLTLISILAFMATTISRPEYRKYVHINKEYPFDFSKRELISRLNMVQIKEIRDLNRSSGQIDFNAEASIFHYQNRNDTLALIIDPDLVSEQDTIEFKSSFAEIMITGNTTESKLKLLTVYKYVPALSDKNYRKKAIRQFEKRIIKKIKKYR